MPRVGYTTTRDPYGTGTTNGEGTFLQGFFAANLTTWTVGALQSFGATNSERNYFVCTNGTHEVLVAIPNGYSSSYFSSVVTEYRTDNDNTANGALGFAYADGGGYAASFVGGFDPGSDVAFYPALSSTVKTIEHYNASAPTLNLYLIENTDHAELIFWASSGSDYPVMWAFSENAYDVSRQPLGSPAPYDWQTNGVYAFDVGSLTSGVPNVSRSYSVAYAPELSTPYEDLSFPAFTTGIDAVADAVQPIDGEYIARRLARSLSIELDGEDYGGYINYNRAFMREFSDVTGTYGRILEGDVSGEEFIHGVRFLLLPWDTTLGLPNTP
jgi:hypothetical protein